ncbi:hypothetical protein [Legionella gresilensis]|uniref:hypothetical protein n=1 Tax=Legionella gresilensis TaxID=91823 RepID=UPI0010414127|nr:hypothetical protein [Legionella gresilensis]
MKKFLLTFFSLLAFSANSICIKNQTDFSLYYEIQNQNTHFPIPKVKFYSGIAEPHQQKCHAHSQVEGDDWKIYRFDNIKMFKTNNYNEHTLVCSRQVEGILNFLEIDYQPWSNQWWCLDRSDYDD